MWIHDESIIVTQYRKINNTVPSCKFYTSWALKMLTIFSGNVYRPTPNNARVMSQ